MKDEPAALKRGSILVATRDDKLHELLCTLNGELELEIDRVTRGRELAARLSPEDLLPHEGEGGSIKILLLDDDLVDGRGRTLLQYVRQIRPDLKIIFTAGGVTQALEIEVRRQGAYFFLPKPINPMILQKVVAKAIAHESTRNRWKTGIE